MSGPTNDDRATWASEAIEVFAKRTGLDTSPDADGVSTVMGDLLADMMHLCRQCSIDFDDVLRVARMHFECEIEY